MNKKHQPKTLFLAAIALFALSAFIFQTTKPTLYIIGDSTVKNGKDKGDGSLWGWGHFIGKYFDQQKINVENHALGGTSSRTFQQKGLWDSVLVKLKKGDYVMMQFGHNDSSPLDDTARARGTIKGVGEESKEIYNPILKKKEVVYTYGWYMRKFVKEAQAKGAVAIVCSPIPRNDWKDGKVIRSVNSYGQWAQEVAKQTNAFFIDLNTLTADEYDRIGQAEVKNFFPGDHTHTNEGGAIINAVEVVKGLKSLTNCTLNKYVLAEK